MRAGGCSCLLHRSVQLLELGVTQGGCLSCSRGPRSLQGTSPCHLPPHKSCSPALRSHGMDIVGPDVEGTPHADLAFQPAAQYEPLMDAVYEVRAVHAAL